MIYVSLSTIPQRIKTLHKSVESLLKQTRKPDKIFINIPKKYQRFKESISDNDIPKFNDISIEITRCDDCGPGTKLLGSLKKIEKNSLVILADDDHLYENYMIEKFVHFYSVEPNNAYSFFVYPVEKFPVGQGADGFAINTNHLDGIENFYEKIVKNYKELFLNDDVWISYFLYFLKKINIFSLQNHIKKRNDGKQALIYKKTTETSGLIQTYGKSLEEAFEKRLRISINSFKYMNEKIKGLTF
tara:strand:- start:511 stop:1242 length:732 start_codon:yes stop_codon:yes gene_type:complete